MSIQGRPRPGRIRAVLGISTLVLIPSTLMLSTIAGITATMPTAAAATLKPSPSPRWLTPADQPRLDKAAGAAASAAGRYYTAVSINDTTGSVHLYLDHAPRSVLLRLRALRGAALHITNTAVQTNAQQLALEASISKRMAAWRAKGLRISFLSPLNSGLLQIGVRSSVSQARSMLAGFADVRRKIQVVQDRNPGTALTFRYSDVPSWNGGDAIYFQLDQFDFQNCSTGIPVHSGSTDYVLTAAHCFWDLTDGNVGTEIRNGYIEVPNGNLYSGSSNKEIGTITKSSNLDSGSPTTDVALIKASSSSVDFNAAWNSSARAVQVGISSNIEGDQVCSAGAFDGQICGLVIKTLNNVKCELTGGACAYHLVMAESSTSGSVAAGTGDSGGPVYSYDGSDVLARGMIDQGTNMVPCTSNPPGSTGTNGRVCDHILYFVDMATIDSNWSVTPNS